MKYPESHILRANFQTRLFPLKNRWIEKQMVPSEWVVMSVCLDNFIFFGQFLCPTLMLRSQLLRFQTEFRNPHSGIRYGYFRNSVWLLRFQNGKVTPRLIRIPIWIRHVHTQSDLNYAAYEQQIKLRSRSFIQDGCAHESRRIAWRQPWQRCKWC
jgi:hypothetical protein